MVLEALPSASFLESTGLLASSDHSWGSTGYDLALTYALFTKGPKQLDIRLDGVQIAGVPFFFTVGPIFVDVCILA